MKNSLIFILLLQSSLSNVYACGYSPYGEDVRYSLFSPNYFDYGDFKAFHYHANLFGFDYENTNVVHYESNVYDWYNYTNKKVPIGEIDECLNTLNRTDLTLGSSNLFVQYLYKNKDTATLHYITTAKKCEAFNILGSGDPWEKGGNEKLDYGAMQKELNNLIALEKTKYLQRKYAFLAIRVAYYCGDLKRIKQLFENHYARGEKDYLYYWASFFNLFDKEMVSVEVANIMAYSSEKKYASYYYFNKQFNLKTALSNAKTPTDLANVYAYASVQRLEPNLEYLKIIYNNSSKSRILDFLLLREINKIEDWVYTPYYTNYLPSIESANNYLDGESNITYTTESLRNRSEKDRLYAKKLLQFIERVDYSTIKDSSLWLSAEIQLLFITRDFEKCQRKINAFAKKYAKERVMSQVEKIKALCIISSQAIGKTRITKEAKSIILKHLNDKHFLFSIGRELEFKQNLADGLALIAYGNNKAKDNFYENNGSVVWSGNRLKNSGNLVYFYDYFDYIDFVYSAKELKEVTNKLNSVGVEDFDKIIYSQLLEDKNYLTDLLGTKYLRENNLKAALTSFESIGQVYWEENYNAWERDKYDESFTFDKNPFYDFKHTPSFIPHTEKYIVTKLSVTQHLINYLNLAQNPSTENRDYYYFLVANCYLNMTQKGHSWMMRRYSSRWYFDRKKYESYVDEREYRNGNLARYYYGLAYKNAKTDKFKALCLRMEGFVSTTTGSNYANLKATYPDYYDDLSNCSNLEVYFRERR